MTGSPQSGCSEAETVFYDAARSQWEEGTQFILTDGEKIMQTPPPPAEGKPTT